MQPHQQQQGVVVPFTRSRSAPPIGWSKIKSDGDELCSFCLMLIEQLDLLRSGHEIDITRNYAAASIVHARQQLKDRGYPTTLLEGGGSQGFGTLKFL